MDNANIETPLKRHPLQSKNVTAIQTWFEWKTHWDMECEYYTLSGLLHHGFSIAVNELDRLDRIRFYLKVADGHNGADSYFKSGAPDSSLYRVEGKGEKVTSATLSRYLACKAYEVLASKLFNPKIHRQPSRDESSIMREWHNSILNTGLLADIMDFFGLSSDTSTESVMVHNLPHWLQRSHHDLSVIEFLTMLIDYVWLCGGIQGEYNDLIQKARIWSLHVLSKLDRIQYLSRFIRVFDNEAASTLRQKVLRTRVEPTDQFSEDRKVRNLKEALVQGSQEALLLVQLDAIRSTQARRHKKSRK